MKSELWRRLERVKQERLSSTDQSTILYCFTKCKDLKDFDPKWAKCGGREFHRTDTETAQEFSSRIAAETKSSPSTMGAHSISARRPTLRYWSSAMAFEFIDNYNNKRNGPQRLFPVATVLGGNRSTPRA
jgi:hypothetical protein